MEFENITHVAVTRKNSQKSFGKVLTYFALYVEIHYFLW